ncbi:proton-conducting transporter membrane subunit [Fodinicurvata sp. EGI_FJ10296]|uniref:complex I subunit 5 family protein n=1 Tax=Fodinicurvata sp. EGI_FJ10296 TaxID=3231908 RepID=UPI003456ED5A
MQPTDLIFTAVILGPIGFAASAALAPGRHVSRLAATALVFVAAAAIVLTAVVAVGGTIGATVGGWPTPLGIALLADRAAAIMVLMAACVLAAAGVHILIEDGWYARSPAVWATILFLWAGLNTLFLTSDLFTAYVTLEVTGLAGVALIALSGTARALTAQIRYLLVATGASLIYLMGVALIYAVTGRLDGHGLVPEMLIPVSLSVDGAGIVLAGVTLMTVGLLIKMAAWPLHGWLPPAHTGAVAPVSAILSALLVKAAALFLLRLWTGPFAGIVPPAAPVLLGLLGTGAIVWGSIQALRQSRLKPIIAYSTVAQMGYLLVAIPIIAAGMPEAAAEAWSGAVIHALSHGLAKAALFLAAGSIVVAAGSDHLRVLIGSTRTMPVAMMAIAVAGVSIMGLPPSAGFLGKWLMLRAAMASDAYVWVVPIVGGGFLSAAYMFKIFAYAFRPLPDSRFQAVADRILGRRRPALEVVALLLAFSSIAVGIAGGGILPLTMAEPGWAGEGR